jgi:Reverse transcriptase (RNA-dependent DNA polymerase)
VVKSRLTNFLSERILLNSFQSVYTTLHSTETALLAAVDDYLIRASIKQQVFFLCLLDFSAAFDTIDHSILLERLSSWFGISGSALYWVKSYLTSRSFYAQVRDSQSSVYQLLYGVPQGSVLGLLLFILYTTPLSTIISKSWFITICTLTTFSFSFLSLLTNSVKIFLFSKAQLLKSLHGCLQIFSCSVI